MQTNIRTGSSDDAELQKTEEAERRDRQPGGPHCRTAYVSLQLILCIYEAVSDSQLASI